MSRELTSAQNGPDPGGQPMTGTARPGSRLHEQIAPRPWNRVTKPERADLFFVQRVNEFDCCSGSRLRIGCFSPAASRLRRSSQQHSSSSERRNN